MLQNVESEILKIDDFLKQLDGGRGQATSSSSLKDTIERFQEWSVLCVEPPSLPHPCQPCGHIQLYLYVP